MNINNLSWNDTEFFHKNTNEYFEKCVNESDTLKNHRNFVEKNGYGFGEKSFHYLWKLICEYQNLYFSFLEIGCYKGQILSLIKLLRPDATVHGVSPLSTEGNYPESDYKADVNYIHDHFGLDRPNIFQGLSTEKWVIDAVKDLGSWDIIYIDGGHDYNTVTSDLEIYSPLVKVGGYMVMDDANCELNMPPGYFRGHQSVTDAKLDWLKTQTDFEFMFSVVHISIFRRIK